MSDEAFIAWWSSLPVSERRERRIRGAARQALGVRDALIRIRHELYQRLPAPRESDDIKLERLREANDL